VPTAQSEQEEEPYEPGGHTSADMGGRNNRIVRSMWVRDQKFVLYIIISWTIARCGA